MKKRNFDSENLCEAEAPLHTLPRLFVAQDLGLGATFALEANQTHYLAHVLRRGLGDKIRVFNGLHGDWVAEIRAIRKQEIEISLIHQHVEQKSEPDVTLYAAPIKRGHFEDMVMKATELGMARFQPILTARTQIRDVNAKRIKEIAKEAAEQSERLSVPSVGEVHDFSWFLANRPSGEVLIFCAEHGEARPLGEALIAAADKIKSDIVESRKHKPSFGILVGPEGGFTREEIAALSALPFAVPVRLGPRILRADTAAVAALACWQALCGDWATDVETLR